MRLRADGEVRHRTLAMRVDGEVRRPTRAAAGAAQHPIRTALGGEARHQHQHKVAAAIAGVIRVAGGKTTRVQETHG
jgi:hypothetical protein